MARWGSRSILSSGRVAYLGMMRAPSIRPADERGAISVTGVLLLAALAALVYAVLGATVTDPDTYGDVPIPSKSTLELPGSETELALAIPSATTLSQFPPPDLRISVGQPGEEPLRVDARGGEEVGQDGYSLRRVAVVFPPVAGAYTVEVTSEQAAAVGGRLLLGEGTTGAIGARFERIGELITGPFGILAIVLVVLAMLLPSFQRALRDNR